jgi:AcrR family transcriptional regulator
VTPGRGGRPGGRTDRQATSGQGGSNPGGFASTPGEEELLPGELPRPAAAPRAEGRRAEIVGAARQILEDEGQEALSMRRVAESLGIRAPSLYKHFDSKAALELALIEDALEEIGELSHLILHTSRPRARLVSLLLAYRAYSLSHPHLYRLGTVGPLPREDLPPKLEEWAGNPWYVVTGDPALAQALWSFAHGMVVLELDRRYPPGSDLDATWQAGARAFEKAAAPRPAKEHSRSRPARAKGAWRRRTVP